MSKSELMLRIQRLSFAKVEAELFLDTHPECPTALEYFHKVATELDEAMAEYQAKYGPIRTEGSSLDRWSWIDTPWPWQEMDAEKSKATNGGKR